MKHSRLALSGLLSAALFFSAAPLTANAQEDSSGSTTGRYTTVGSETPVAPLALKKKKANKAYWKRFHPSTTSTPQGTWDVDRCVVGELTPESRKAQVKAINYLRALAGLNPVKANNASWNREAQAAAVVMAANQQLTHAPTPNMKCYTDDAYRGASQGNLSIWYQDEPNSHWVRAYMDDVGDSNTLVGHRRWLLNPTATTIGVGNASSEGVAASAIKVFDNASYDYTLQAGPPWVSYPSQGFFPAPLSPQRWSLSSDHLNANFNDATVSVTYKGRPIDVVRHYPMNGMGRPTLAWEMPANTYKRPGKYVVSVAGVQGSGRYAYTYTVKLFRPTPIG